MNITVLNTPQEMASLNLMPVPVFKQNSAEVGCLLFSWIMDQMKADLCHGVSLGLEAQILCPSAFVLSPTACGCSDWILLGTRSAFALSVRLLALY